MPTPYRRAPTELKPPDEMMVAARWDDRILGLVMVVLGAPRAVLTVATHESFGAESTIAVIVAALGLLLLLGTRRR